MPVNNLLIHTTLMVSTFLSILSGFRYFRYRTPMARWGGLFLFTLAIELFSFSFYLLGVEPGIQRFLCVINFTSFFLLPIFWLLFVTEIAGVMKKIHLPAALLGLGALALGLAGLLVAWMAGLGPLAPVQAIPESFFQLTELPGGLGTFYVFVYYILGIISCIILFFLCFKTNVASRKLVIPMLLGTLLLGLLNTLDRFAFNPLEPYLLQQIGLAGGSFLFFLVTVVWQFGGILPISRESVFEGTHDGVLVLDYYDTIVDINGNALKVIGLKRKDAVGHKLARVWPLGARLIADNRGKTHLAQECDLLVDGQELNFDVSISQFIGLNDAPTGRLIVLRNVTTRERMEKALNERAQELWRSNAFMGALAEVTLNLHTTTGPEKIATVVGSELKKLGLLCMIAQLDPASSELAVKYVSVQPEVIERIEKILGVKLLDYQLDKKQFPRLYGILEANKIGFRELNREDLSYGTGKIPAFVIEQILRLMDIERETKTLVLPFVTGTRSLGLMCVWGENLREKDIAPFRVFASQVAHVLERAILYEAEKQRSAELARSNSLVMSLSKVASVLGSTFNSEVVLDLLGSELMKAGLNCAVASIDPITQAARLKYLSFNPGLVLKIEKLTGLDLKNLTVSRGSWPGDKVLTQPEPVWYAHPNQVMRRMFPTVPDRIAKKALELLDFSDEDQLCVVPLRIGQDTTGIMLSWGPNLKPADSAILSVFGSQIGGILQNVVNYEMEVHRKDELARSNAMVIALSNVAARLDTTADVMQVFDTLGSELRKVQVNCMVGTLDEAKQLMKIEYLSISPDIIRLAEKMGAFWPKEVTIPRRLWPTDKAITEKAPYWDPDPIGNVSRMFPLLPRQIFTKSFELAGMSLEDQVCYLPMMIEEDVIGILAMWGPLLNHADIPAFSVFANQVATAIRATRLYDQAQKEIIERKQAEQHIQQALDEKEVLLKEVHHRVKNNLQVISSLLNLQAAQIPDARTVDLLRESQNRVHSMALIHEKLYQSNDLARVDFAGYLQNLVHSLAQTYQSNPEQVALQISCEKIELSIDTAIPCGLIVNELVSNSLKYAFSSGRSGMIGVSCCRIPGQRYRLTVADNGAGLPDGFNISRSSSLGLKLVISLVRQIEGEIVVSGKHGAHFEITFSES